jgi:serine/threonine protein kinase
VGICLAKYDKTLSDVIPDQQGEIDVGNIMNGIRSGVDHLHHLGYIHGDLHRDNIMFSEGDNTLIIIDFDSCRKEGERLGLKPGAYEYRDKSVRFAIRETDNKALDFFRKYIAEGKAQWSGNAETNATAI